jgi:hypothetical protein
MVWWLVPEQDGDAFHASDPLVDSAITTTATGDVVGFSRRRVGGVPTQLDR